VALYSVRDLIINAVFYKSLFRKNRPLGRLKVPVQWVVTDTEMIVSSWKVPWEVANASQDFLVLPTRQRKTKEKKKGFVVDLGLQSRTMERGVDILR
jgi:hypothetical protein